MGPIKERDQEMGLVFTPSVGRAGVRAPGLEVSSFPCTA